jgi:hypothetical protein
LFVEDFASAKQPVKGGRRIGRASGIMIFLDYTARYRNRDGANRPIGLSQPFIHDHLNPRD